MLKKLGKFIAVSCMTLCMACILNTPYTKAEDVNDEKTEDTSDDVYVISKTYTESVGTPNIELNTAVLKDEDVIEYGDGVVLVRESYSEESNALTRMVQRSYSETYGIYMDNIKIGTIYLAINANCDVPNGSGHIAQITRCDVTITPHTNSSDYYVNSTGYTKSISNGSPATITVSVPIYKKVTNVKWNTLVLVRRVSSGGDYY
ncbi:MAG: hypothetical protein J5962_05980 [Lachnospiraceae bacterium]|nr:hypothetical protein [Lachnospiraceae bacterium]